MLETLRFFLRSWMYPRSPSPDPTQMEYDVKNVCSLAELDACLSASAERPILLFKHSTACPISAEAFRQVGSYATQAGPDQPEVYLVKVIEVRPVSNRIADLLGVIHKSPQLLLVKDNAAVWTTSHYGINLKSIQEALTKHLPARA